jgi:hypothetical protein
MSCEELEDLFELYWMGLLESGERDEIDAHLNRGCETCRKNLRGAAAVNALMLGSVPVETPPGRLKHRVLGGFGVTRPGWGWLGALAAACMLIVALWLSVQERRREDELADARRQLLQTVAQRDRLTEAIGFLNQPETRQVNFGQGAVQPPRGNVFVNSRLGVLLIASNLPPLPAGRAYEMWVIYKGGAPRPAGLFEGAAQGSALHILSGPIDTQALAVVAVTNEPEAGSPAPTSTPIIAATL